MTETPEKRFDKLLEAMLKGDPPKRKHGDRATPAEKQPAPK